MTQVASPPNASVKQSNHFTDDRSVTVSNGVATGVVSADTSADPTSTVVRIRIYVPDVNYRVRAVRVACIHVFIRTRQQ